jgi:hypothetical protein
MKEEESKEEREEEKEISFKSQLETEAQKSQVGFKIELYLKAFLALPVI